MSRPMKKAVRSCEDMPPMLQGLAMDVWIARVFLLGLFSEAKCMCMSMDV